MKAWLAVAALGTLGACGTFDDPPLFELRSARGTGIDFANTLQEDDSLYNPLAFDYIYNGAGVAVGDLNNDGRADLYFAGNQVSSRLYLNQGELEFEDVTGPSGAGTSVWATGVTLVDIDQNGLLDIYLCVAGRDETKRANLLFVNQGVGADGVPRFTEQAKAYGIDDTGYSTHAVFFDYDRDGDLDLYVLTNALERLNRNMIRPKMVKGEAASTDRLYRNDGGRYTNVSAAAGITIEGYGLGVVVSDLNQDGWPDLYVSNDFITNDLVWINNRDGTFTNRAGQYLKHQAHNGMGADVADFNNDARPDIMVVDMLPPDNLRQKLMVGRGNYDAFNMALYLGYQPQYVRNTLQLNLGPGPDGQPRFSEIGQLAGVEATDWSWAPLLADFDNDGLKDLFISNGYRRDVTNLDYIVYTQEESYASPEERRLELYNALKRVPEVKLHNYLFRNNGDLTFSEVSEEWGMEDASYSNGAAYADLDGDGDLDLVVNNLDGVATLYANRAERLEGRHHLRVALRGPAGNLGGYGAKVVAHYAGRHQYLENFPYRGYKSTVEGALHFGLGAATVVDSLEVYWPDGRYQLLTGVEAGRTVSVDHRQAGVAPARARRAPAPTLVTPAAPGHGLEMVHQERTLADFKITPLLPRKYSKDGPGLAVGDVDGNGLDDVFVGADPDQPRALFLQSAPGRFARRPLAMDSSYEDMGALFFDADGDRDQDLYVVSGGAYSRQAVSARFHQDRLYVNDGKGGLTLAPAALPVDSASGSSVVAADYDRDGDLDLFVGGRLVPGEYPLPARSFLLRNDSRPGAPRFTDVTRAAAPALEHAGMVTSALWTDFDGDARVDLVVAGEWMPLTFLHNQGGKLVDVTASSGLEKSHGWWNSLAAGDFDGDGDTDYLAGNLGLNSRFRASPTEPVRVHARDYDGNGSVDPILSYYLEGESYPVAPRDVMIDQIISMKGRFKRYADYAAVPLEGTFTEAELDSAYVAETYTMASSLVENLGGGKFALRPLPTAAQLAPVYGMVVADRNADGALDAVLVGNSFATETLFGWYDASVGTVLLGNGKGGFSPAPFAETGFFVDGDAKAAAELMVDRERSLLLVSQNGDSLKVYESAPAGRRNVRLNPLDAFAVITLSDGSTRREEFHHGSTFLSQSSRFLALPPGARKAVIHDYAGKSRAVEF